MIKIPSTIHKITTLVDRGLKLEIYTQELTEEANAELFKLHNKIGVFCFAENDIQEKDLQYLPDIKIEKWAKSPSQRLRNVLYKLWETTSREKTFEEFYITSMEDLIDKLKEQLA